MARCFDNQPVSRVAWVHRSRLRANAYNPNHVSPIELALLATSIYSDGWTQPIVCTPDGQIIDGYHRWLVSERIEIYAMTDGYVPVVYLDKPDADRMLSTVRHNRARGVHGVTKMSELVRVLLDEHRMTEKEVCGKLGMELEELHRLYDNASMPQRAGQDDFSQGWIPRKG